jgi:hypothetical protein
MPSVFKFRIDMFSARENKWTTQGSFDNHMDTFNKYLELVSEYPETDIRMTLTKLEETVVATYSPDART